MKNSAFARFSLSLLLILSLMSPLTALAIGDGKKHFKQGMKHEIAEQWDKAVEEFAIAVSENPRNPEYKLHLQRALFNASQMYMKIGNTSAQQKDYESAYTAYRKAYAYDPVNELAKSEMARMVRMQEALKRGEDPEGKPDANGKLKLTPVSYNAQQPQDVQIPQRLEKMRDVPFPGGVDLQYIVKELAKDLDLNVLFDAESRLENRRIRIELKNVTAAKALDYIFLQENLFFQKVGPRTILVATGNRRTNFQQLVLRTFYLANANPKDVKTVITSAIPAQPGRSQTIVIEDATTNSLTIRDTEENVRLFAKLISSLDKDRAEVVMDVAIYEVNKTELLRIGNQIGATVNNVNQLNNVGGSNAGAIALNNGAWAANIATNIATGLLIPSSVISAFQSKQNTKLLASTQIHAFNNEDSSARIGQRVPVQTAQFVTGANQTNDGVVSNVINYEQVGLTLKFKPIVFPNQDVQVAMEIESKDVADGGTFENPIFTERTIKGTARVQNNKTLLLASVAQDVEGNGRAGLPVLGWIPIIGRLFATPTRNNRQVDIVIAVTPRVIRAPAILPEDEIERPTGSLATPTSGSLEAMIIQEEIEENLAASRRLPTVAQVQLPDRSADAPAYVRTGTDAATTTQPTTTTPTETPTTAAPKNDGVALNLVPIDTGVRTLQIKPTSDTSDATVTEPKTLDSLPAQVQLTLASSLPEMKAGEKTRIPVMIKSTGEFSSAMLGLAFDDKKLAVRSVIYGDIFGMGIANTAAAPMVNSGGKMFVSLSANGKTALATDGVLAFVEIEALVDGKHEVVLEKDIMNFRAGDGRYLPVKY